MTTYSDTSPRPATTGDDTSPADELFTLTIKDVEQRYFDAGLPRNVRSIQRYASVDKII